MAGQSIFISYRRQDSAKSADDLYSALAKRIGQSHLYKDIDNIPLGADFGAHIRNILPRCQIALILIGPNWAEARDQSGRRRLDDQYDWVRVEAEFALASPDLRVVPVLVDGAQMPRASEVPASLHPLLGRNAAIVRGGPELDLDADRLLYALAPILAPETIRIPAGEFTMGSSEQQAGSTAERPHRRLRIRAFELGRYPVTFAEWDAAIAAGALLERPDDNGFGRDRRPVFNVSWDDAQAYIAWLNSKAGTGYRLPSEAEWEYSCRAGTTTAYSTGTIITTSQAHFKSKFTAPVDAFPPNAFGLYDMHGNVGEWCEDLWHEDYNGAPSDGSAWTSKGGGLSLRAFSVSSAGTIEDAEPVKTPIRVCRGGSWYTTLQYLRSAYRSRLRQDVRGITVGFRVARTL